jgi:pimeloyl-ACP methyl ester carboxylesterase
MPRITVNGCQYYYEDVGSGPETIVFGHGFLVTHRVWEHQIEALRDRYRCVAFDWRGQGWSDVTKDGYGVLELCEDVIQLVEQLDVGPCHYVGLSMGGFVGFRLLLRSPDWLRSAALIGTQAEAETRSAQRRYEAMLFTARYVGYDWVLDQVMQRMFGPAFLDDPANARERERWRGIIASNDPRGVYRAGTGIFRRPTVLPLLGAIQTPTLLVAGADDVVAPVTHVRRAQQALPDAELAILPAAGHTAPVESPEAVTNALDAFITAHSATPVP